MKTAVILLKKVVIVWKMITTGMKNDCHGYVFCYEKWSLLKTMVKKDDSGFENWVRHGL